MPTLDRNVLRLAVYEIKFAGTPPKVAVNEAIELSRKFSTEESTAFINGVLDALAGLGGQKQDPTSACPRPANRPSSRPPHRNEPMSDDMSFSHQLRVGLVGAGMIVDETYRPAFLASLETTRLFACLR